MVRPGSAISLAPRGTRGRVPVLSGRSLVGRAIAVLGAGIVIDRFFDDKYRYIFPLSIVLAVASIWIATRIPNLRNEARKAGKVSE